MFSPKWTMLKRGNASESGQTMVEFALVGAVFLLLVFGMFDLAYYFYGRVTLQNAVRQAARYAITGNCGSGSSCFGNNGSAGDRVSTLITTVVNYSFGLVTCNGWSGSYCTASSNVAITCQPASGSGSCSNLYQDGANNAGGPEDTIIITATYVWNPLFIPNFVPRGWFPTSYSYSVSSAFKNEQFPPAS